MREAISKSNNERVITLAVGAPLKNVFGQPSPENRSIGSIVTINAFYFKDLLIRTRSSNQMKLITIPFWREWPILIVRWVNYQLARSTTPSKIATKRRMNWTINSISFEGQWPQFAAKLCSKIYYYFQCRGFTWSCAIVRVQKKYPAHVLATRTTSTMEFHSKSISWIRAISVLNVWNVVIMRCVC